MRKLSRLVACLAAAGFVSLAPGRAFAQSSTTGSLSGVIVDESGGVVPGASIEAVHQPTGTRYSDVAQADGGFSILNMRAGGPYTVTVTLSGFKPQTQNNVFVKLGEECRCGSGWPSRASRRRSR